MSESVCLAPMIDCLQGPLDDTLRNDVIHSLGTNLVKRRQRWVSPFV